MRRHRRDEPALLVVAQNAFVAPDPDVLVAQDAHGLIESEQFPGLKLHVSSMLDGDLAAVLGHLQAAR